MLGVSRQRVHNLTQGNNSFPAPEAELIGGKVWSRREVESWMEQVGRGEGPVRLACDFCNRSEPEVEHLVTGPGVYICNFCVDAAADALALKRSNNR